MSAETWELERAARAFEVEAGHCRTQASIVRAMVNLSWEGPGAPGYREEAASRWAGLLRLAQAHERLAEQLRHLAGVLEAA